MPKYINHFHFKVINFIILDNCMYTTSINNFVWIKYNKCIIIIQFSIVSFIINSLMKYKYLNISTNNNKWCTCIGTNQKVKKKKKCFH